MELCQIDDCCLNLYEKGKQYFYSKNSNNEKYRISEDFRLFITYNQFSIEPNKRLSPCFLNKCLIYSLFPIDNNKLDTAFILSRAFIKNKKLSKIYKQLSAKLSEIHFECKKLAEKENSLIGSKKFCGRTILTICNYINSNQNIKEGIIQAIKDCYCNTFSNKKKLKINY